MKKRMDFLFFHDDVGMFHLKSRGKNKPFFLLKLCLDLKIVKYL